MKKIFFVGLMTFAAVSLMAEVKVATFENEAGGINVAKADTCWQGADNPVADPVTGTFYTWQSGDFKFQTYAANWGGFQGFTVTNESSNEVTKMGYDKPYRSASGGAYEGQNFAVWNAWGGDTVSFDLQVVKGFFVNNTPYAVGGITTNNYSPANQFKQSDYLVLKCIGLKDKKPVNTVEVYLAKDGKYIDKWTYVDLSSLGEISGMVFEMDGSDQSYGYLNTPAYFAMDNFGAAKPDAYVVPEMKSFEVATALENTEAAAPATKVLRNGQLFILHNGVMYNVQGARVE